MFKVTLKDARELSGYTEEEVAFYSGISVETLIKYETNSEQIPLSIISKILSKLRVSSECIFFGTQADCIKYNRNNAGVTKG